MNNTVSTPVRERITVTRTLDSRGGIFVECSSSLPYKVCWNILPSTVNSLKKYGKLETFLQGGVI